MDAAAIAQHGVTLVTHALFRKACVAPARRQAPGSWLHGSQRDANGFRERGERARDPPNTARERDAQK